MTKYMNDPEVKCQSRLIACVLAPEAEAASRMLVEMRDASTALVLVALGLAANR